MTWRSKGIPLAISAIFLIQIIAPMIVFPDDELSFNQESEALSINLTSGSGHDLEGDAISVDGKDWDVRGESVLDYWDLTKHNDSSNKTMDLIVTEDGIGLACSINGSDVNLHTFDLFGSYDTLLVETLSTQSTDTCAIAIGKQDRIQIIYNVGDDLRLARLAEVNAVYLEPTWHLRTIVEDVFNGGLTMSMDLDFKTQIMFQDVDMALHHVWFNKAYWNQTILDDGPIGEDIEMAIDSNGMIHVVYTNSAEGEVRLIKFNETIEVRQVLARGSTVSSAIGMDLDSNNIEQITYSKSDGLGNNSISLLRSLAGKDTGRIDPEPKWTINYDDDSAEGIVDSGDLNGDGKDDLIYTDPDGNGTISIHYGSPDGPDVLADRILVGSFSDSMLGTGLAIGDFNCDGIDDIASSEPGLAFNNSGHISIRLGSSSGISTDAWWELNGSADDDNLGWSLTSLGDVESDGCTDLAVVANKMIEEHASNPNLNKNGMVVVFKGNQTSMIHHANITQTESGTMFGRQVIGNGDMNGDGFMDMVVSNTDSTDSPTGYSSVEFFFGNSSGINTTRFNSHAPLDTGKLYGIEMAFVGDIHGDGYDDILISELYANTVPYHSGKVHIWEGSSSGPVANGALKGDSANALLGESISPAGDINEDGFDDFMLMAPSSTKSGNVDLYLGSPDGPRMDVQLFAQGSSGENVGLNLLSGMDLNGDGMKEILYSSRDLTRGENFGPVLTIMSERDWEFVDFDFDQPVISIEMHTPLRGSPSIMTMLSDSSLLLLEHTPDGTPSGRWITRDLASADTANIGISSSGQPLILFHSSNELMTLTVTGNTALDYSLSSVNGLGKQMDSALDSNGLQRLGHASPDYSSIFYTEENSTEFTTTTVRSGIDILYPIQMHVDSDDLSRMVYVDDDDNMVRLATLNGTWDEVSILNTTIGDDFDTIWDGSDALIFAQIAVSNNSTMLQIVEYQNSTTTVTDLVNANLSSSFELTELDEKWVISLMDSDKLTVFERLATGGNWSIAKELWLLGETEGHSLAMEGQLILFDANNTVQGLLIEDGAGSWVHYLMDIPDTNSSYEVLAAGYRWHATSTNEFGQLVWTSGTMNTTRIMETPVVSTTFPAIITNSPVPLDEGADGKLMFAYSQSSTNDFYAMRFVSDQDRDLIPDSHDDKPRLGNQWADSDNDGYGDNPLGPSPDECPAIPGTSKFDRSGCGDYDGDGWSDVSDDCANDDGTSWWGRYGCDDDDQDGWVDDGVIGDRFPTNWKQALDTDRDTFGDNHGPDCCNVTVLGEVETSIPDLFPYNRMQWEDDDEDGYGDNESDVEFGDKCFWVQGFSWRDRLGCVDTDGDGSSDPSDFGTSREWNETHGADWWPLDGTQWADSDVDGYGDNSSDDATLPDKFPNNPSAANDSDNDGYPNNWTALDNGTGLDVVSNRAGLTLDNCPNLAGNSTSSVDSLGQIVAYYGCTDTDGDGREDSADAFPEDYTQSDDSDGDGWGDSQSGTNPDRCPYDFGVFNGTDGAGCPIIGDIVDLDSDNVPDDGTDECLGTELGQTVDSVGCSEYQKDDDQDEVSNAEDMCPGTTIGDSVDSIGCSESQSEVDTDGDGVNDPIDLCPDSNLELSIDDNGCNLSQKDTDGDGLNDLDDDCPETEVQFVPYVDTNGCFDETALVEDIDDDGYQGPYTYNPDNDTHEGDAFPLDPTQWEDMDGDGYGDSQALDAVNSDDCPEVWGNSSMKSRFGCLDSDGDGYHDLLGDDKFPANPTQWEDKDLDDWGDNPDGTDADLCLETSSAGDRIGQARANFGCADYQSDSDNDGVMDDVDACQNTVAGAEVYPSGCKKETQVEPDTDAELIMGMEQTLFITLAGVGGLAILGLLFIIVTKLRGRDDLNFDEEDDDDWDEDEDEDDFTPSSPGRSASPSREPSRGPPGASPSRGPSSGPGGPSRGPSSGPGGPNRGPSSGPGGPNRGPPAGPAPSSGPGGPSRGPPGTSGPTRGPASPDPSGPARGKKVAKRKPVGEGKVRKTKLEIDPNLFSKEELADRVAAVDWTKGALKDGDTERTILMQLQTTGWSAPQSRAIIDLSNQ
ncbi:MAG: hypothetical protein ACKVG2_03190 [Candidatus Poseidoniales archaeon]